ncbi:hypothetical protein [Spirosoma aerophilum]
MEKLFCDKVRVNFEYAQHQHDTYEFYDNSAIEKFEKVRNKLNDWFSRYPDSAKKQLKRDFQSNFDSAFFELFVHELFLQQGFSLIPHPAVPNSTKNPDFLAKKGEVEIYLEAKVATDESNAERAIKAKQNVIYDTINQIKCPDYWISVKEINFLSNKQAKLSRIKQSLQHNIDKYGDLFVSKKEDTYFDRQEKCITYKDENIEIAISLWPCSVEKSRPIGSYLGDSFMGGCEESIRNAIKAKGYRYGTLNKPYIVCINSLSYKHTYTEDVYDALFGRERVKSFVDLNNLNQEFKSSSDGIFDESFKHSYSSVSGVFITRVFPSNMHVADHWLIKHPFSSNALDFNNLDLSFAHVNGNKIEEVSKMVIADIMK